MTAETDRQFDPEARIAAIHHQIQHAFDRDDIERIVDVFVADLLARLTAQQERIDNLKFDMNLVGAQLGISTREEVEPAVRALVQRAEQAEARLTQRDQEKDTLERAGIELGKYCEHLKTQLAQRDQEIAMKTTQTTNELYYVGPGPDVAEEYYKHRIAELEALLASRPTAGEDTTA